MLSPTKTVSRFLLRNDDHLWRVFGECNIRVAAARTPSAFTSELGGPLAADLLHHFGMVTSARFKFTATLIVSVLAVVLTLAIGADAEGSDAPSRVASPLPPAPR